MKIPELKIGDLVAKLPIVQGGMGVGISLSNLASSVANCGGIGVISGVEIGFNRPNYLKDKANENIEALKYHIRKARELSPKGIIGVNLMTVLGNFKEMVVEAVKENIDIIFSGAGLPLELPDLVKGSKTKIVPIVSSSKAAGTICKYWDRKKEYCPDAMVVEGPEAGGHLGFAKDDLKPEKKRSLLDILAEVQEVIKPFEEKYQKKIPLIAAGGVFTGADIGRLLTAGASGVQMGTRFVGTYECDASQGFKEEYLRATEEDVILIDSPVGLPGRAIRNTFLDGVAEGLTLSPKCRFHCLTTCRPKESPYCIADALINAQKGNMDKGFAFAGTNACKVKEIVSVRELMDDLAAGILAY
jgi:nitronate monooxygenase